MILGFQDRFLPFIEEGSKRHTIRAGHRWRAGMRADLFRNTRRPKKFDAAGVQTAGMALLFRAPVVRVEEIVIENTVPTERKHTGSFLRVSIGSELLDGHEVEALFVRDGFKPNDGGSASRQAYEFWRDRLPFAGQIIHWDFDARTTEAK